MKLRKLREDDRPLLAEWMAADPYHAGYSTNLFFEEGTEGMVFEDDDGPVMFVNLARSLRAFVQFHPTDRQRSHTMLREAFGFVANRARTGGVKEIIFNSRSPRVIAFCKKRLGFRESPHEFVADL